jgi:hypothetical protein
VNQGCSRGEYTNAINSLRGGPPVSPRGRNGGLASPCRHPLSHLSHLSHRFRTNRIFGRYASHAWLASPHLSRLSRLSRLSHLFRTNPLPLPCLTCLTWLTVFAQTAFLVAIAPFPAQWPAQPGDSSENRSFFVLRGSPPAQRRADNFDAPAGIGLPCARPAQRITNATRSGRLGCSRPWPARLRVPGRPCA